MHISNWKAKRSGPSITITGNADVDGSHVRITDIAIIEPRRSIVVAVQRGGAEYILRVGK